MPRERPAVRKDDTPGKGGRSSPQLAVNEIGDPAKHEANWSAHRDIVEHTKPGKFAVSAEQENRQADPEGAAMKRHPAAPQGEDTEWIRQIGCRLVKQDIGQASTGNDADGGLRDEFVRIIAPEGCIFIPDQVNEIEPAKDNPGKVRHTVPAQGERPHLQQHRVEPQRCKRDTVLCALHETHE